MSDARGGRPGTSDGGCADDAAAAPAPELLPESEGAAGGARTSVCSTVADETPRDRLLALLEDVICGHLPDAAVAREVRDAVIDNTLFVPHALAGALHAQAQPHAATPAQVGASAAPEGSAASGDAAAAKQTDRALSADLLNDPFLRETIAPMAALAGGGRGAGASPALDRRSSLRLGRSESLLHDRGAAPPAPAASDAPGGQEGSSAPSQNTPLPVDAQLCQLLHELPPAERHELAPLPPHVQAGVLAAGASGSATLPELVALLQRVPFYDFSAFEFSTAAGGAPLSALFALLFVKLGLIDTFAIDLRTLARFTRAVEARMPRNGYHSSEHIADVVHSTAILLTGGLQDLASLNEDPLCVLSLLLAAAIHDFEHPGLTGDHLVAVGHPWALAHNDRAVLEHHHLAAAFSLLGQPGLDWTAGLAPAQRAALRATVIDLVLSTEMKEHFKLLGEFGNVQHRLRLHATQRRRRRRSSIAVQGGDGAAAAEATAAAPAAEALQTTLSDTERLLVLKIALKVADLGHLRAPRDVHLRWVSGLMSEFYTQGDVERSIGMRVNDMMCRERAAATPGALAESQVGFFDVIALPLVTHWAKATGARRWLERVTRNYTYWREQRDALAGSSPVAAAPGAAGEQPTTGGSGVRIAGLPLQLSIPEGAENRSSSTSSRARSRSSDHHVAARGSGGSVRRTLRRISSAGVSRGVEAEAGGGEADEGCTSTSGDAEAAAAEDADAEAVATAPRRVRRRSIDSLASSPPPSGSASDCGAGEAVCSWCGLPPLHGARRLSRDARAAAAAAGAAAAAAASGRDSDEARSSSDGERVRSRRARFSETDACRGLRATRIQYEEFKRISRSSGSAAAAAQLARTSLADGDAPEGDAAPGDDTCRARRTSEVSQPTSVLGRHRVGIAAAAAAAAADGQLLDDSAADHSPPPPGERTARRSTGSVTFEFDDAFAVDDAADGVSGGRTSLDGVGRLGRVTSSFTSSDSSWGESEERFGTLCMARSLDV